MINKDLICRSWRYDLGDLNEYLLFKMRCFWVTLLAMLRLIYP